MTDDQHAGTRVEAMSLAFEERCTINVAILYAANLTAEELESCDSMLTVSADVMIDDIGKCGFDIVRRRDQAPAGGAVVVSDELYRHCPVCKPMRDKDEWFWDGCESPDCDFGYVPAIGVALVRESEGR